MAFLGVTYQRFYSSPGQFRLVDGRLAYAAMSPEIADVITYDAATDCITITSGSTDESFTLVRTARENADSTPADAQPPDWLLEKITSLARNAGNQDAAAWWTLTTAEKAVWSKARMPPASVANPERPVYVFVVHGDFTRWLWSLPSGTSAPEYSWVFELIDAESHVADGGGNSSAPFDTTGLDMQPVMLTKCQRADRWVGVGSPRRETGTHLTRASSGSQTRNAKAVHYPLSPNARDSRLNIGLLRAAPVSLTRQQDRRLKEAQRATRARTRETCCHIDVVGSLPQVVCVETPKADQIPADCRDPRCHRSAAASDLRVLNHFPTFQECT